MDKKKWKCLKCKKYFSSKGNLSKHNSRSPNCNVKIQCHKCGQTFKRKGHLTDHLNRITSCIPIIGDTSINTNITENKCHFCSKVLANKYSLKRHLKTCVKKSHKMLIQKLETELEPVSIPPTTQIINNTYNDNRQINITIVPVGNIDINELLPLNVLKRLLLNYNKNTIPKTVEYIYANPEHPERFNLIIPTRGNGKVYVFGISNENPTVKEWRIESLPFVSEMVTQQIKGRIYMRETSNVISSELVEMANDDEGFTAYHKIPEAMQFTGKTPSEQQCIEEILHKVIHINGCPALPDLE